MSLLKYKVTELPLEKLSFNTEFEESDKKLIESFSVNEKFDTIQHNLGLYVYTPDNDLLVLHEEQKIFKLLNPNPLVSSEKYRIGLELE